MGAGNFLRSSRSACFWANAVQRPATFQSRVPPPAIIEMQEDLGQDGWSPFDRGDQTFMAEFIKVN
jgi:hypothetical protein